MSRPIIDFHAHPFDCEERNICAYRENADMSIKNTKRDLLRLGVKKFAAR